ncbi:MAG: radical SAM protein [Pseudomonadota bacterium]
MAFEQGPIRPPSEARSLLLRVTRNCPWNRCAFCPVYKGKKFSRRKEEEIIGDIDAVARGLDAAVELSRSMGCGGEVTAPVVQALVQSPGVAEAEAAAGVWLYHGEGSVFLQDSDALVIPAAAIIRVLRHLRETLPMITRVTCYSRSATLAKKGAGALKQIREAGLDRVHAGLESGSKNVLELIQKGATPETHVRAGRAAMDAGLELSEYVMPGIGGKEFSREHAVESARVISEISPDFTRLRSLGIRGRTPIRNMVDKGEIEVLDDDGMVKEIRLLIENLAGARTMLVSDHILNLLGNLEGRLPGDQAKLLAIIDAYLELPRKEKDIFRLGRRACVFNSTDDLRNPGRRRIAEGIYEEAQSSGMTIDEMCREMLSRMI